jgi:phosphotransferase system enzyme I (PtsP)
MTVNKLRGPAKVNRLVLLQRIVHEVSAASDLHEAARIIVKRVKQAMQMDVCSIYLLDPANQTLVMSATEGLTPVVAGKVRLDCVEGLVGLVVTRSEPVNVRDAARHPRFKSSPQCEENPYHGFLGVPVMHRGEMLGVIVVQQAHAQRYRDTDVAFLVTLAVQLAGVIALARAAGTISLFSSDQGEHEYYVDAIAGAPGVATGTGVVNFSPALLDSVPDRVPEDMQAEEAALRAAVGAVVTELRQLHSEFKGALQPEDRALFEALAMIASSQTLVEAAVDRIHSGNWAPGALRETIAEYANQFAAIEDPYLRERARDIQDIGRRILAHLEPSENEQIDYPARSILVAEDLGPVDIARVPVERLAGVISARGSALSHVAILARAMGIPAIVGTAGVIAVNQLDGRELVLDGYRGRLHVNPSSALVDEYSRLIREERALSRELAHLRELPAETPDGFRVALYTNAGIQADLGHSQAVGAEGIGLYRTELQYMLRDQFPGEEELRVVYRQVLEAFAPYPVTLRTLDVGSDKTLPYFPVDEPNPALGWRGVRFALDNPVIFITQLRAMIRASAGLENLRILIPMVSSVEEADEAIQLVRRTWEELVKEGETVTLPPCGLMIEVPSAVWQASSLARYADFLSVGTNDLTQYLIAVDRSNGRVASRFECLHPAVIGALQHVVAAGRQQNIPVSICGEAAGDPAMAILLLGMGINSLSMSASDLPRIKSVIRTITREQALSLLNDVLQIERAAIIRELLTGVLVKAGLGGLVRAGA